MNTEKKKMKKKKKKKQKNWNVCFVLVVIIYSKLISLMLAISSFKIVNLLIASKTNFINIITKNFKKKIFVLNYFNL